MTDNIAVVVVELAFLVLIVVVVAASSAFHDYICQTDFHSYFHSPENRLRSRLGLQLLEGGREVRC